MFEKIKSIVIKIFSWVYLKAKWIIESGLSWLVIGIALATPILYVIVLGLDTFEIWGVTYITILTTFYVFLGTVIVALTLLQKRFFKYFFDGTDENKVKKEVKAVSSLTVNWAITKYATALPTKVQDSLRFIGPQIVFLGIWRQIKSYGFNFLIAVLVALLGAVGAYFMSKQNNLLAIQNSYIKTQMNIEESSRVVEWLSLLENVLAKVDSAIELDPTPGPKKLNDFLIKEISSLSYFFKPYNYLEIEGDTLMDLHLSPERGFLLVSLLDRNIDKKSYDKIFEHSTFEYADLENVDLDSCYLKGITLNYANLRNVSLKGADMSDAEINYSHLQEAKLIGCNLLNSSANYAYFNYADLTRANLMISEMNGAHFIGTDFSFTRLDAAELMACDFMSAVIYKTNISKTNFLNTKNTYEIQFRTALFKSSAKHLDLKKKKTD